MEYKTYMCICRYTCMLYDVCNGWFQIHVGLSNAVCHNIYIYILYIYILYTNIIIIVIYIYMPVLTRNDDKPPEVSKIFGASDLPNQLSSMSLASCAKASPLGPMAVAACRKSRRWWRNRGYMTLDNGYMTIMGYNGYTIKWNDGYMTLNND